MTAIELDPLAANAAERGAPDGFRVLRGSTEARLAEALPTDLVILNPPRSGIAASVAESLVESGPHGIVYVSCDPATLARDVARLSPVYRIERLRAFDLFPQTPLVEALVDLRRVDADIGDPSESNGATPSRVSRA